MHQSFSVALALSFAALALASGGANDWSYSGRDGPQRWGLKPEYSACDKGKAQSPVNLLSSRVKKEGFPELVMPSLKKANVSTSKHTIQWTPADGAEGGNDRFMVVGGAKYSLAQFHIHTPSEHHVDDKYYDSELHFVHKTADGKLAVLGVFLEESVAENPLWSAALSKVPDVGKSTVLDTLLDTSEIKAAVGNGYYNYQGSLTTPPCSEGVQWFVASTPIRMSLAQIKSVAKIIGFSARPVQYNEALAAQSDDGHSGHDGHGAQDDKGKESAASSQDKHSGAATGIATSVASFAGLAALLALMF
ncbi:alpha carbonic anhydrase [Catenaria anguillulae PL171]|uniref:Carbonic anhydrase n=1 Tax=Catenaria anguillulae PL171 TaxID=765915 RepID=A0A1Y2H9N5_9FUNG|nr:alpha carbonic anhydrase [Catenaria anguillulae PL171]